MFKKKWSDELNTRPFVNPLAASAFTRLINVASIIRAVTRVSPWAALVVGAAAVSACVCGRELEEDGESDRGGRARGQELAHVSLSSRTWALFRVVLAVRLACCIIQWTWVGKKGAGRLPHSNGWDGNLLTCQQLGKHSHKEATFSLPGNHAAHKHRGLFTPAERAAIILCCFYYNHYFWLSLKWAEILHKQPTEPPLSQRCAV